MTIETKIHELIAKQTGLAQSRIQPGDELVARLGCDSLDLVELMMALEEEFGIDIEDDEFIALKTVQQAVDHVRALAGATA